MSDNEKYPGLYIGTSGWSYQHWSGIFYPIDIQPDKYLEHYITKFNCVELNSSFYHLPRDTTISGWAKRTPEKFRFCPKMSRFITHQMRLAKIEEPLKKYFDLFKGMRMRLGPILVQLPPGLSYNKSLVVDFLGTLKNQYFEYRFAIEIRHKSWIRDDFFDLLIQGSDILITRLSRQVLFTCGFTVVKSYMRQIIVKQIYIIMQARLGNGYMKIRKFGHFLTTTSMVLQQRMQRD
jgi:uncharacterized protein YecE (DUF72 family)